MASNRVAGARPVKAVMEGQGRLGGTGSLGREVRQAATAHQGKAQSMTNWGSREATGNRGRPVAMGIRGRLADMDRLGREDSQAANGRPRMMTPGLLGAEVRA
jgi:hypothetical protein